MAPSPAGNRPFCTDGGKQVCCNLDGTGDQTHTLLAVKPVPPTPPPLDYRHGAQRQGMGRKKPGSKEVRKQFLGQREKR